MSGGSELRGGETLDDGPVFVYSMIQPRGGTAAAGDGDTASAQEPGISADSTSSRSRGNSHGNGSGGAEYSAFTTPMPAPLVSVVAPSGNREDYTYSNMGTPMAVIKKSRPPPVAIHSYTTATTASPATSTTTASTGTEDSSSSSSISPTAHGGGAVSSPTRGPMSAPAASRWKLSSVPPQAPQHPRSRQQRQLRQGSQPQLPPPAQSQSLSQPQRPPPPPPQQQRQQPELQRQHISVRGAGVATAARRLAAENTEYTLHTLPLQRLLPAIRAEFLEVERATLNMRGYNFATSQRYPTLNRYSNILAIEETLFPPRRADRQQQRGAASSFTTTSTAAAGGAGGGGGGSGGSNPISPGANNVSVPGPNSRSSPAERQPLFSSSADKKEPAAANLFSRVGQRSSQRSNGSSSRGSSSRGSSSRGSSSRGSSSKGSSSTACGGSGIATTGLVFSGYDGIYNYGLPAEEAEGEDSSSSNGGDGGGGRGSSFSFAVGTPAAARGPPAANPPNFPYINGNRVSFARDGISPLFIACQAPLPSNLEDFYETIWRHRVGLVVMVTGTVEGGVVKADRYWPPGASDVAFERSIASGLRDRRNMFAAEMDASPRRGRPGGPRVRSASSSSLSNSGGGGGGNSGGRCRGNMIRGNFSANASTDYLTFGDLIASKDPDAPYHHDESLMLHLRPLILQPRASFMAALNQKKNSSSRSDAVPRTASATASSGGAMQLPPLKVLQVQYTGWPDHGVPSSNDSFNALLALIQEYSSNSNNRSGSSLSGNADYHFSGGGGVGPNDGSTPPVIVHCSAGIGRTGSLIGVHAVLQLMAQRRLVNSSMRDTLLLMRASRYGMVQRIEQYLYMYGFILGSFGYRDLEAYHAQVPRQAEIYMAELSAELRRAKQQRLR